MCSIAVADFAFWIAGQAALLVALLFVTALCSASEAALFSLTRVQLRECSASRRWSRRLVADVMAHPDRTLLVILLASTAANVQLFASSYVFFSGLATWLGGWITPVSGVLSLVIAVVFGEVLPKVLAVCMPGRFAPYAAILIRLGGYILYPIARLLSVAVIDPVSRVVAGSTTVTAHNLSTDELKALLQLSTRQGAIHELESAFLQEVVDLGRIKVRDVMVPRVDVKAYDVDAPFDGLRDLMRRTRLKKIPVFQGTIDNVVGLVYAKVLFLGSHKRLREIVMPVRFVPESATCEQLLRHFRETRSQLAIAVDEYGGMAGLVTLEDLLEEIVGDIRDPEDAAPEPEIVAVSDTMYEVTGRLSARYWAHTFGVRDLDVQATTVSGLITSRLGRPARAGDLVSFGNVELLVMRVHRHRIDRVRVCLRALDPTPQAERE